MSFWLYLRLFPHEGNDNKTNINDCLVFPVSIHSDSTISTPAHSPSPRKPELNGVKRTARNGASSVGTSEDGEESSSVPDEDDDVASIVEQLSNVQLPQVSEITSRGALIQWCAPTSDGLASHNRDLQYNVLLSDRGKEGKYKVIFKGKSLSCRIRDLRPGQEYYVCLQVLNYSGAFCEVEQVLFIKFPL